MQQSTVGAIEIAAPLAEVFYSVQGEGLLVGLPQIFVRLAGCDLDCLYCDTPYARSCPPLARFEGLGGEQHTAENPVALSDVVAAVGELREGHPGNAVHSCALTGGEPLLYPDFCLALAGALQQCDLPVLLETAGHHPGALRRISPFVSWVCMDLKLPSTLRTPLPLELFAWSAAACQAELFVKVPVAEIVSAEEFSEGVGVLAEARSELTLIVQPITSAGGLTAPRFPRLLDMLNIAAQLFSEVRIIPQCHQLMGAP